MVRVWVSTALAVALLVGGAVVAALLAWPEGAIGASPRGLAAFSLPGFAGSVDAVHVTDPAGKPVPVAFRDGTIWPLARVDAGEELTVTVNVRRPGWIGWLVGQRTERVRTVETPVAHLRASLLRPSRGERVRVSFDVPVSRVAIGGSHGHRLGAGRRVVPLGVVASGATTAGTTTVSAAARPWEKLSQPIRVSWFVAGPRVRVVASPAAGGTLAPGATLTLTFSQSVSSVLGSTLPRIEPATAGHWSQLDAHTLSFRPAGFGFPLGGTVHVRLPHGSLGGSADPVLTWHVTPGSTLRLQEILARLGYLPVRWRDPGGRPSTPAQELAAAVSPPHGVFSWRFPGTPASLQTLWKAGIWNIVTKGAVMRFEDTHGLATDGVAGPHVWRALLRDDLANRHLDGGYTYVFVHETVPESLNLWHDGQVILTSPGNTGIPQAPTAPGTWPVFEHVSSGTMSGTNPDGSHYNDPGVRWISYFHGGDALHAFPRSSYGTPQSLGCVELPEDAAAQVWPYTPIGTLVTIEP